MITLRQKKNDIVGHLRFKEYLANKILREFIKNETYNYSCYVITKLPVFMKY